MAPARAYALLFLAVGGAGFCAPLAHRCGSSAAAAALRGKKTRGTGGAAPAGDGAPVPAADGAAPRASSVEEAAAELAGAREETSEMRVGDLTAELDIRGVDYADCVEADELRSRLAEARLAGKASPDVVDAFNRNRAERMADPSVPSPLEVTEEEMASIKNADGTLPGGLKPDDVFKLMNDPKIATMMASPKFQEILKDTMGGGGAGALSRHMADPDAREMLLTLTTVLKDAGMVPPRA